MQITVRLEEVEGERIAVRVHDRGVGISPTELKRIFKRFYRVPTAVAVRAKGSGLGLFIVRSVAKKHGGQRVRGERGRGPGQHVHAAAAASAGAAEAKLSSAS